MRQLDDSAAVPACVKVVINLLAEEIAALKLERDKLYEENAILRRKLGIPSDIPIVSIVSEIDAPSVPVHASSTAGLRNCDGSSCYQEIERRRSVVISGIPELDSTSVSDRVRCDYLSG